jgi:hypothetical protein
MRRGMQAAVGLASMAVVLATGATAAGAVIGTDEGANEAYRFAAQVQVGGEIGSGCTGALVAPQWVITAKQCFGAEVPAGAPQQATTVTVGRTDRSTTAGQVLGVTRLVPHPDRDVVLARLAQTVKGVPPVRVATTAPGEGDELRLLGFGRTGDAWVPDRLHGATVTVGAVGTSTLTAEPAGGDAALCMGDAGGPALRTTNGVAELVGLHKESGQKGCYTFEGGDARTVETRVDDLAGWIATTSKPVCNAGGGVVDQGGVNGPWPDFTGDCVADIIGNTTGGELRAWAGSGDTSGQTIVFNVGPRVVQTGATAAAAPRVVVGDFNGDNKTDLIRQNPNGDLNSWLSSGDLSANNLLFPGGGPNVGVGWTNARVPRILTGDFNGDGRTDIAAQYVNGGIRAWNSTGRDGALFVGQYATHDTLGLTVANYPRLLTMDVDGDQDSDVIAQDTAGALWLYRSSGDLSGVNTLWNTPRLHVGSGWTTARIPRILTGDWNGDEKDDIAAVFADGNLRTWITIDNPTRPFTGAWQDSTPGFTVASTPRLMVGDQDYDGRDDLLTTASDGKLWLWRSGGDSSLRTPLFPAPARLAGTGWVSGTFLRVF